MRYKILGIAVCIMLLFTVAAASAGTISRNAIMKTKPGPAVPLEEVPNPNTPTEDSIESGEMELNEDIEILDDPGEPFCPIYEPPDPEFMDESGDDDDDYEKPPIP